MYFVSKTGLKNKIWDHVLLLSFCYLWRKPDMWRKKRGISQSHQQKCTEIWGNLDSYNFQTTWSNILKFGIYRPYSFSFCILNPFFIQICFKRSMPITNHMVGVILQSHSKWNCLWYKMIIQKYFIAIIQVCMIPTLSLMYMYVFQVYNPW